MKKRALLFLLIALMVLKSGGQMVAQDMALKTNLLYDATTTINLGYEFKLDHKTTLDIWVNYNPWTLGKKWVGLYERQYNPEIGNAVAYASASERQSKLKHIAIQPELRWWLCESFNGHFFGAHLHAGLFNVGALKLPFDWGRYKDAQGEYLGGYPVSMTPVNHENVRIQGIGYRPSNTAYPGLVGSENFESNDIYWGNADRDGIYTNSFEGWLLGAGVSYGYHMILSPRFSLEFTAGIGYAFLKYDKNRCTDCTKKIGEEVSHYFGPTRVGLSLVYMLK